MSAGGFIVLDTLGRLDAHSHGLSGYRRPCRRYFRVTMPVLIAARGADSAVVGVRPLKCAGCGERETEMGITVPSKGGS
jgi:hypothetical protein